MGDFYTVLDLETTGISAANMAEIIEVSAYHTDGIRILDNFHSYIKPWQSVPAAATKVNNITNEILVDKPNRWKVLPELSRFINNSIVVAHNAVFDVGFLNTYFFQMDLPLIDKYICTLRNYKKIMPNSKATLSDVCEHYGISLENAHSAEADTYATTQVFIKMFAEAELETIILNKNELVTNIIKKISGGMPHKKSTELMTYSPKHINPIILNDTDIMSYFRMGKSPNDICDISGNDYRETVDKFLNWINNVRATKFFPLISDKKLTKEINAMIDIVNSFDELLELHKKIYDKKTNVYNNPNLSIYAMYWAISKKSSNKEYDYKDFEWHFMEQKSILEISKEFNISAFVIADKYVEFAEKNREEYRPYISNNVCTIKQLRELIEKVDFINIVNTNPTELDIKRYLSKILYDRGFFKIKLD